MFLAVQPTFTPLPMPIEGIDVAVARAVLNQHRRAYQHHMNMVQITFGAANDFHCQRANDALEQCVKSVKLLSDTWKLRSN